jgi:hypothetical protein
MGRWIYPVDPGCPAVEDYHRTVCEDPMTTAMSAPVDEILEDFDNRHRVACERCREYGAANVDVEY